MNTRILRVSWIGFVLLTATLTACGSAPTAAAETPTPLLFATETLPSISTPTAPLSSPSLETVAPTIETAAVIPTQTSAPVASNFCADPQVTALIDSLKKAVTTADGELLASLVSPTNGMDVAFFHNGNVIKYDQEHTKFLFETTYEADWGAHPASGEKF